MVFSAKQLEEIESIHDSNMSFDDDNEDKPSSEDGDNAMAWRRTMISEAAENVKRAKARPVDPKISYPVKTLLFDRETNRYARVAQSMEGYLKLIYLTGGEREYGQLDPEKYLQTYGATIPVSSLAEQLELGEEEVLGMLEKMGIEPAPDIEEEEEEIIVTKKASSSKTKSSKKSSTKKTAPKKTATKDAKPKKAKAKSSKKANMEETNAYIKANYETKSNKEMADVTGLSEHTIRRKLGEWGLKRSRKKKK